MGMGGATKRKVVEILNALPTSFPVALDRRRTVRALCLRDHNGQQLAYVYFEDEPGRRSAAKLPTRDEARRTAANIAKLPELVHKVD